LIFPSSKCLFSSPKIFIFLTTEESSILMSIV
jgi:hypothetical protein